MNLVELTKYTSDEECAEEYLRQQGILKTFPDCPYCHGTRINRVGEPNTNVTPAIVNGGSGAIAFSKG